MLQKENNNINTNQNLVSKLNANEIIIANSINKNTHILNNSSVKKLHMRRSVIIGNYDNKKLRNIIENKKNEKKLNFGIGLVLKNFLCKSYLTPKQEEKMKLYYFSKKYLKDRLDITFYLKTLSTLDRIKLFLFNHYQNLCLDFIKKPNLHNKEELETLDFDISQNHNKNANKVVDYFNEKIKTSQIEQHDLQLLQMLDDTIKNHIIT